MRLEVRSINMGNKGEYACGVRREDLGIYDADTGLMIQGVQEARFIFNVNGPGRLEIDVIWKRDDKKNEFDFDENGLYGGGPDQLLIHNPSQKTLDGVSGLDLNDEKGIMTIAVIDFDAKLDILRPHKKEVNCAKGTN